MPVQLEDIIISLYDCGIGTTEHDIRANVKDTFQKIGKSQPTLFIKSTHAYLMQNTKLSSLNRAYILSIISEVLDIPTVISKLDQQECLLTINLAIQEMLMSKDKEDENEWSESARNILLVISKDDKLVTNVLDGLLQKFPPGVTTPPNKSITMTLASIAQCNPKGFAPFLTDILSRSTVLLSHMKGDVLKSTWSKAISSFCEALIELSSEEEVNNENTSSLLPKISEKLRADYCDQMEKVFDSIIVWLNSKDIKTRADTFEAVGTLTMLITQERVLKELKKIVTSFLQLYKKGSLEDQYNMTKGICNFLLRCCSDDNIPIEFYFDDICNCLFPHVAVHNDQLDDLTKSTVNAVQMRLRNEVCRCFLAASQRFGDKLVYFLLHKMQSVQDSTKLGAIDLIRHLLNSAEANMEDKRSLIVMGLKPLLCDDTLSARVKCQLCQLCVALADHGYVHIDSGGTNVIHFLTANLIADGEVSNKKVIMPTTTEINQLRTQSAKALCTIANTCESARQLLWPNLLEFVCAENYNSVIKDIFKCLRILIKRMKEDDYGISFNFDNNINPKVAGKYSVLSRLISTMNIAPLSMNLIPRAKESILLLKEIGKYIHPLMEKIIDEHIDDLLLTLDETVNPNDTINSPNKSPSRFSPEPVLQTMDIKKVKVEKFNGKIMNLLKDIVNMSNTAEWLESFASSQGKLLGIYNKTPYDKAFLMQCLGYTLSRITTDTFVKEHIILMFRVTNHINQIERKGCASAVGYCAKQHTTLMLTELENIAKWEHTKKSGGGFIGFIKESIPYSKSTDPTVIYLRSTIILSYGYLVTLSPEEYLPQRLEQTILPFLRHYMIDIKNDVIVRESHLETIYMIAKSVNKLTTDYKLEARYEMFSYIKEYVNMEMPIETLSTFIRLYACKACTELIKLEPPISDNEIFDLTNLLSNYVFTICREKPGLKTIDDDESSIMDATVHEYRNVIAVMIKKRPVVDTVCQMLKIFKQYYGSQQDVERLRSIDITVLLLKLYLKTATDFQIGHANDFSPLSGLLARLTPRIVDSYCAIRLLAIQAVWLSFQLSFLHKGQISRTGEDSGLGDSPELFNLDEFRENYLGFDGKLDTMKGRNAISAISEEIEKYLPQSQLQTYLSALFKMLQDKQNNVSSASAQLLSVILKDRGNLLHEESEILVQTILDNLPIVHPYIQTYTDLLNGLSYFADHQLYSVVDVLLKQSIPYTNSVEDAWKTMIRQSNKFSSAADQVLDLMNCNLVENDENKSNIHYETVDLQGGCIVKLVNPHLCANISALTVMIKSGGADDIINERFSKFLFVIIHNLVSVIDVQYPSSISNVTDNKKKKELPIITPELKRLTTTPLTLITDTLRALLERIKAENVIETMNTERAWTHLIQSDSYISAIGIVCRSLCDYYPEYMRLLMLLSVDNAHSKCDYLRISSAAILSSLITRCPQNTGEFDDTLLDKVVTELKLFVQDKNLLVRKLAIRGYTSIGTLASSMSNGDSIAQKYARLAFEAALNGLDDAYDRKDEIAAESMYALDSVISIVDKKYIESSLSNLLLKLRPCFEKENPCLRSVAFSLFGKLGTIVGDNDIFKQNIHENIVSIMLHLNDDEEQVKNNCAIVLIQITPLLSLDSLTTVIHESIINEKPPNSYNSFLKDIGMILVLSFPDRLNFYALGCSNYYKSQFSQIRANAVLFTGYLLEPLSSALRGTLSKELLFSNLVQLLRDPASKVRLATIKAISCLHSFP